MRRSPRGVRFVALGPEGVGGGGGCGGMAALWQTSGTATYTGALGRGSIMVEAKYLETKSERGKFTGLHRQQGKWWRIELLSAARNGGEKGAVGFL
jgi:hypothetical protein